MTREEHVAGLLLLLAVGVLMLLLLSIPGW